MRIQMYFFPFMALKAMPERRFWQFKTDTDQVVSFWTSHQFHTDLGYLFGYMRTCKCSVKDVCIENTHWLTSALMWRNLALQIIHLCPIVWYYYYDYFFVLYSHFCVAVEKTQVFPYYKPCISSILLKIVFFFPNTNSLIHVRNVESSIHFKNILLNIIIRII